MPTSIFEGKLVKFFFGKHVLLKFITDHISYIHELSNEWALYNNRVDKC